MSLYVEHFAKDYDWCTEINIHRKDACTASEYVLWSDSLCGQQCIRKPIFTENIFGKVIYIYLDNFKTISDLCHFHGAKMIR